MMAEIAALEYQTCYATWNNQTTSLWATAIISEQIVLIIRTICSEIIAVAYSEDHWFSIFLRIMGNKIYTEE